MTEWRSIDSAPRDGTEVIITDGHNVGGGFWNDGAECRRAEAGWFWEMDRGGLLTAKNARPSHWQALPPPPTDETTR